MSSHFSSLALTISQTGSFGGLLPGYKAMSVKRAVAALSRDGDESEGGRPAKRVKGKKPVRESIDDGPVGGGSGPSGQGPQQAMALGVCLRCSKRIDQNAEHMLRGKTVAVGYRCDLSAYRKYSYCALTSHDCEPVGSLLLCVGLSNGSAGAREVPYNRRRFGSKKGCPRRCYWGEFSLLLPCVPADSLGDGAGSA